MRQRIIQATAAFALVLVTALPGANPGLAHNQSLDVEFSDLNTANTALALPVPAPHVAARPQSTALKSPGTAQPAAATCTKLTASSPASWFATDSDGNVDTSTEVDNYPSGTIVIAPGFTYNCSPKDIDIVVIIYNQAYGNEPALVEKRTLPASPSAGVFFYALTTPDGTALQEGQWRVAFYQGKTPLSTGEILLGGSADVDVTKQAVLQGSVTDLRSGQPVVDARIFVLNPGVTVEDFAADTKREDVYVQTRTDDQGEFSFWKPLDRNTQYAMLIAAEGYKLRGTDRLIIGDQATSPVNLDIKVVQR
jgi:hypothetical protein